MAVIGAGTMGNGITHVFAQHGWGVTLVDVAASQLEKALGTIAKNVDRQIKKGMISEKDRAEVLGRIATSSALDDVSSAELVVEAASESPEVKFSIFEQLDRIARPEAVLASNTSSISITEIGARTARADRVIGMHFMNPVPVMALVEIIRGIATSDETTATVVAATEALGKTPVEVNDYPGFVSNRVLMPMINEAVFCVMEGVAEPDAIDTVMKLGMNHPMGPLALADLIGLDVCLSIMEVLHSGFERHTSNPMRSASASGPIG